MNKPGLLRRLIDKMLGWKWSNKGNFKYKLEKNSIKNTLIPKVDGYKLEELYVGMIIEVISTSFDEYDEQEEFDYNLLSGEDVAPISDADYNTNVVKDFVVLRAGGEYDDKEFYDIFNGKGYNRFDFTAEQGEEYVDDVRSFQKFAKFYIDSFSVKTYPKISSNDIIKLRDAVIDMIDDLDGAEDDGLITKLDYFLDSKYDFKKLLWLWYNVARYQGKLEKEN